MAGVRVDHLVCDEAQFSSPEQVEELARILDDLGVDVVAFGITADFRTRLFPGSQRLVELADRVQVLPVEALCWCGARATSTARTLDGVMVVEGPQVVVGDVDELPGEIGDETLLPPPPRAPDDRLGRPRRRDVTRRAPVRPRRLRRSTRQTLLR